MAFLSLENTPLTDDNEIYVNRFDGDDKIINLPIKYSKDSEVINKTIGNNKKIRLLTTSNNNIIYDMYSLVRKNFLRFEASTDYNCSLSMDEWANITLKTIINSITDYYYSDIACRGYFDEIIPVSCDGKLFREHREWIMPVFHTEFMDKNSNRDYKYLYVLIDKIEIERFFIYYIYAYKTKTIKVDVEFANKDMHDKIDNRKTKSFLENVNDVPVFRMFKEFADGEKTDNNSDVNGDEGAIHNFMFGFTLLCVDKVIAITNGMLKHSGKIKIGNNSEQTRSSIIEILGDVEIVFNKKKFRDNTTCSNGVVTFDSI